MKTHFLFFFICIIVGCSIQKSNVEKSLSQACDVGRASYMVGEYLAVVTSYGSSSVITDNNSEHNTHMRVVRKKLAHNEGQVFLFLFKTEDTEFSMYPVSKYCALRERPAYGLYPRGRVIKFVRSELVDPDEIISQEELERILNKQ